MIEAVLGQLRPSTRSELLRSRTCDNGARLEAQRAAIVPPTPRGPRSWVGEGGAKICTVNRPRTQLALHDRGVLSRTNVGYEPESQVALRRPRIGARAASGSRSKGQRASTYSLPGVSRRHYRPCCVDDRCVPGDRKRVRSSADEVAAGCFGPCSERVQLACRRRSRPTVRCHRPTFRRQTTR